MGRVRRGWALLPLALLLVLVACPSPAHAVTPQDTTTPTTCGDVAVQPGHARCFIDVAAPAPATAGVRPFTTGATSAGWTPQDITSMYGLPAIPATVPVGSGPTVALVEVGGMLGLSAELNTYREQFGLGACDAGTGCLTVLDQDGTTTPPPAVAGWEWEIMLDVEAVSASCPVCRILVVDADSSDSTDTDVATETAAERADYVSMSWGSDDAGLTASDVASTEAIFAAHPDVTFVASSGDFGWSTHDLLAGVVCGSSSPSSVAGGRATHSCSSYPASSPHVVAVGGTVASRGTGAWTQSVWGARQDDGSLNAGGASSGCSGWTTMPAFQVADTAAVAACGDARGTADLSALADGFAMYHSGYSDGPWYPAGGTSLAAPLIAGMYARADNHTHPFDIYARAQAEPGAFADVTTGGGTRGCPSTDVLHLHLCSAGPGWDGPTGLGTPTGIASLRAFTPPTAPTPTAQKVTHSGAVRLRGKARPHAKLRAAYGIFASASSVTVTWLVNGRPVAHGRHVRVKRAWVHRKIRYVVTASGAGLSALTLRSPQVHVRR